MLQDCFLDRPSPDIEAGLAPLLTPSGLLAELRCATPFVLLHLPSMPSAMHIDQTAICLCPGNVCLS